MNVRVDAAFPGLGNTSQPRGSARGWDFLGNVPVPLRQRVRDGVADLTAGRGDLKCCFPMGQGGRGPFERLRYIRALDDFPGMLVSADHGNAFNRAFHRRHVEGGAFAACQPDGVAPVFRDLLDPKGWIGVFAVAPFVMLADKNRLGALPPPRRWADLTQPEYRGQLVFSGWRPPGADRVRQLNLFFLLSMARELGLNGLERLLRNVPALMHSTQMPRVAGGGASVGGIYILPWSLAAMCPRRAETELIWPEDGALAYPLWLTAQQDQRRRLDPLLRYFHGADLASYLNHNRYPALCPGSEAGLPPQAGFKWLGWDFLRHPATAALVKAVRALTAHSLEGVACG